jgi:NADH-quinone oxidoreductase subunit N
MLSLAGIPPTIGFYGKLVMISALIANGYVILAVIAILISVVAAFYYLKVIKVMYFDEPTHVAVAKPDSFSYLVYLAFGLFVFVLGIFPEWLMDIIKEIFKHA